MGKQWGSCQHMAWHELTIGDDGKAYHSYQSHCKTPAACCRELFHVDIAVAPEGDKNSKGDGMDYDDDSRDGVLFRFWIRAASYPGGFPAALMRALKDCHTPADYRRALTELAKDKGVNLPEPGQ